MNVNKRSYLVSFCAALNVRVFSRCGLKTVGPSGGSGSGTSKWTCARTATCPSSAASCSRMTTCTLPTPTTTGPTRAWPRPRCPPRTSLFSTPWVPSHLSPCSRRPTPSPPWPWHPAWAPPPCRACPPRVSTTSVTWTGSVRPVSTRPCRPRLVRMGLRGHRTAFTGTLATPAWPHSDSNPNSTRRLDTAGCRAPEPAWTPVSTTADGPDAWPGVHAPKYARVIHVHGVRAFETTCGWKEIDRKATLLDWLQTFFRKKEKWIMRVLCVYRWTCTAIEMSRVFVSFLKRWRRVTLLHCTYITVNIYWPILKKRWWDFFSVLCLLAFEDRRQRRCCARIQIKKKQKQENSSLRVHIPCCFCVYACSHRALTPSSDNTGMFLSFCLKPRYRHVLTWVQRVLYVNVRLCRISLV